MYLNETILYLVNFSMKFVSSCAFKSNFLSFNLFADLTFLIKSIKFQIEYSIIFVFTIDNHAFQSLNVLNLSFFLLFVILLSERR